jgi:hypothetical protein
MDQFKEITYSGKDLNSNHKKELALQMKGKRQSQAIINSP